MQGVTHRPTRSEYASAAPVVVLPPVLLPPVLPPPANVASSPAVPVLLLIGLPRFPIDSRRGVSFQAKISLFQDLQVVDMMHERSELQLLVTDGCLTYP